MAHDRFACLSVLAGLGLALSTFGSVADDPPAHGDAPSAATATPLIADLDGNGWADLAIGVPLEDVETEAGTIVNAGGVNFAFGSAGGISSVARFWSQEEYGIEGDAEEGELFGNALAMGDFDGDGYTDLAIGISNDNVGTAADAGSVQVLYGSPGGPSSTNQLWNQNSPGIPDTSEPGDLFGLALAAGDFNRDGYADLAIGAPFEDLTAVSDAGVVHVLYGSPAGLTAAGTRVLSQDTAGMPDLAEAGDLFGQALAVGEFGNGPQADLAIGVPNEGLGVTEQAGGVHVVYGSARGLTATGTQFFTQDTPGVANPSERFDRFGSPLAAANFGGTAHDDLAIGIPDEDVGGTCCLSDHGAVIVLYGSASGLTATGSQFVHQNIAGVPDAAESFDAFGDALAGGDFNGDGIADLAVGVPGESIGTLAGAGAVHVFYGSPTGLTGIGTQFLTEDSPGILGEAGAGERFGGALAAANFGQPIDPDLGYADLAIGVPKDRVNLTRGVGSVRVLYGSSAGLTAVGAAFLTQPAFGGDPAELDDEFGSDLTAH